MKKVCSIVLLSFILLLSCESPNSPNSNSEEYFPLKVGNKWFYNSTSADTTSIDVIWEIIATKTINDKVYYEITINKNKYNFIDTLYYRLNGDTLFSKRMNYDEVIVADFSLILYDTAYWQSDLKVTNKTDNTITFATPFRADYGNSITFEKGVGITLWIQNGFVYYKFKLIKTELK